ncbi:hypothetical protein GCM10023201_35010 [Actinomycetospora corticicola]
MTFETPAVAATRSIEVPATPCAASRRTVASSTAASLLRSFGRPRRDGAGDTGSMGPERTEADMASPAENA